MSCFIPVPEPHIWLEIGKAVIGPFIGAGLAFAAHALNERRKDRRANLAAGNLATSILQRHLQAYFNVRRGFLEDRTSRFQAMGNHIPKWLHFKPMVYTFPPGLQFDFQPLAFLFEQGDSDVVTKLAIAEHRYLDLAAIVDTFNATTEKLQQRLVEIGVIDGAEFNVHDVQAQLGPAVVGKVSGLVDALVRRFDEDENDYKVAARSLYTAMRKSYSEKEVTKLVPLAGFAQLELPPKFRLPGVVV